MITKKERNALKKILGNHYTTKVVAVLFAFGIIDKSGETHSPDFIRQVFNGIREHKQIEEAIIEAALIEKEKTNALKRKKAKLLKSIS